MRRKDTVIVSLITLLVILFLLPITFLLYTVVVNGLKVIISYGPRFFIDLPPNPGEGLGGIGPALEGSLYMVSLAVLISAPISIFTGVFLSFFERSKIASLIRASLELMVEFPTIVIGIVIFTILVVEIGLGLNGITAAMALAIVMLPYSTIQISEALRIPKKLYEEVAYSLGLTTWQVIKLVMYIGRRGIINGLLIGFAKIIGETAPIIFLTSSTANLYIKTFNTAVTGIPVMIYNYAFSGYSNLNEVAWGASFVLIILVTIIFVVVRKMAK
ncbi:binding-protein-dependent transport systems inner membrane component [Sulfolobus islandicus Y.G.57.14]|uniref:Binding-protein-dependent transport systems inner membrane component n=4 Tax=Saccharolobus islandicus TaxID=43080 RepID=C3MQS5_SACI2|nr:PstA family ABC transporter permease [Sulfolobus islandicus]ACP35738.1 binding-protein-dependent transport systems inner membrane component [Sulfolobus islandicus L.S.2.15]ACP45962.1 binding-protein-dependent transport systems inner membrane component [Sulfolobus islandicus Y.G.57.14]ACP55605.1 binding-protein-dependent transport systems inner membrane component [Sulfolobus islandicus M.16.27]ADB87527.1 binding-protein-dependent transport systems inner membrane component [Sulfolobus islandic